MPINAQFAVQFIAGIVLLTVSIGIVLLCVARLLARE